MKSPSIERLHDKLNKQIKLAQSYTEIDGLEFIIKACRLKPYDYICQERKDRDNRIIVHKLWVDEFGNSFNIIKNKRIHITYNDLRLDRTKIVSTDLYYGLSLNQVVSMSKLFYLIVGKDEDLYKDCCLITFLGIDNHLRSYLYWYGEWQQVSPLLMGIKNLQLIADNLDNRYFIRLKNKNNSIMPCVSSVSYISYLPICKEFLDTIKTQYEWLLPILVKNEHS
jgi:hypothetical protein